MKTWLPGLTGVLLLGLGACDEVPTQVADIGEIRVSVVAASTDFVQCGQEIPVTATVTDAKGKAVIGFLVNFRVLAGAGSMFAGSALTDSRGMARDYWTVGSGANLENTLEVRAVAPTTGDKNTYFAQTITTLSKIAFVSYRDGNPDVYVMNPDGTGVTRLTDHPQADESPAWSPDGRKIVFESYRDGNREIYVMNADGTAQTNLTNHGATDTGPAWSPDGSRIAFTSNRGGNYQVYVMNADGTAPTNLTNGTAVDALPAWSPDGSRIAFISSRDGNREIYVMKADGTGVTRLTNDPAWDTYPAWSPDGERIAFTSDRIGADRTYVMNADGTGQTRLGNYVLEVDDRDPAWSPDGRKIVSMVSYPSSSWNVKVMNPDGTEVTFLTNGPGVNGLPDWSGCTAP